MINLEKYIGREFDPETWNCWSLCHAILRDESGIIVPSFAEHYEDIKKYKKLSEVFEHEQQHPEIWQPIQPGQEKEFDIILMRIRSLPIHVGIVTDPGWMLHVFEECDTVRENYRRLKWQYRVLGFYRHRSLTTDERR